MPEVLWYYARNDQQFGPVSASELKQLAESGRLSPDDLLWREGMDAWATAINLRGLFSAEAPAGANTPSQAMVATTPATATLPKPRVEPQPAPGGGGIPLRSLLGFVQILLWTVCVLVVLVGAVMFTRGYLDAEKPGEDTTAALIFGSFSLAAYVLAQAGQHLSRLLLSRSRR